MIDVQSLLPIGFKFTDNGEYYTVSGNGYWTDLKLRQQDFQLSQDEFCERILNPIIANHNLPDGWR